MTYNGTGLTDAGYYVGSSSPVGGAIKTYYGYSLATSTHNVVVSASASCILYASVATYTGVKQSGFPDASGTGNPLLDSGAVTLFQATTTSITNNAWAILAGVPSVGGAATAGANTTIRQQQSGNLYYADSGGPISPAGPTGLSWSIGTTSHWAANYFSIAPYLSNPGTTTTTLYTYDANGNLTSIGSPLGTTTYAYDFDNRLVQSIINGITTLYGYDAFGQRVSQTASSSTTYYPNKFTSITNATTTANATSTDYVYGGSTLFETVDQPLVNGVATGSSTLRYIHTDNLGSTNITSDATQKAAQWFDYAPYGSIVASSNTGSTTDARQYIGQYTDNTGLSYLNARYYNGAQGQFTSEDPVFWGQQNVQDPQSLNAYSYSENNPIINSDPDGKCPWCIVAAGAFGFASGVTYQGFQNYQSTGSLFPGSFSQNVKSYGAAGTEGALAGAGAAYVGTIAAAYELSSILTFGAVGGTAGSLNFGLTAAGNAYTGQPTDYSRLAFDSGVDAVTAGALTYLPGIRGANPQSFSSAVNFLKKTHAAQWGAESLVGTSMSMVGSSGYQSASFGAGRSYSGGATSQLQSGTSFSTAQVAAKSLGVGNTGSGSFTGTYNFGSAGTFNFGAGQWQK